MAARVIRKAPDVTMQGLDHHGGLYYYNVFTGLGVIPGPPVPIPPGFWPMPPFSFHYVVTNAVWGGEHKDNPTVIAEGAPIVSKGHEPKQVVHIPPGGNLLIPVTTYFAGSKWLLGVASVRAKAGPLASTIAGDTGVNYNCQDPFSFPAPNITKATCSVHVQPKGSDFAAVALEMAIQSALEAIVSYLLPLGFDALKKAVGKAIAKRLAGAAAKEAVEAATKKLAEAAAEKAAKEAAERAAQGAAKEAAEKEIGHVAEQEIDQTLRNILGILSTTTTGKEAGEAAAKGAAEVTGKEAAEGIKDVTKGTAKEMTEAAVKDYATDIGAEGGEKAAKEAGEAAEKAVQKKLNIVQGGADWVEGAAGDTTKDIVNKGKDALMGND